MGTSMIEGTIPGQCLPGVNICPQKNQPIKYGDWIHSAMIASHRMSIATSWAKKFVVQPRLVIAQTVTIRPAK